MESSTDNIPRNIQSLKPIFKPYKIYEWKGCHWLCRCNFPPDHMNMIECSIDGCDNWGHRSCYELNDVYLARHYHICDDCQTKKRRGRPKKWTTEDRAKLNALRIEKKYSFDRIARALHRTVEAVKNEYNNKMCMKNNETVQNTNNKQKKTKKSDDISTYHCSRCNTYFSDGKAYIDHMVSHQKKKNEGKFHCSRCNKYFSNGRAYGGHMGHHTRKDSKMKSVQTLPKSFGDHKQERTHKMTLRRRSSPIKRNNGGTKYNSYNNCNFNDIRNEKRKKNQKRQTENQEEPPNKRQKLNDNKTKLNGFEKLPFENWTAEDTKIFLTNNVSEFKELMNKNPKLKQEWEKTNMNGKTLMYIYNNKKYEYLESIGIVEMLPRMKIMDAIEKEMQ